MKTKIVKVGNSQGVLLSKSIIKQYGFKSEVEIDVTEKGVLISPVTEYPRAGWSDQFKKAIERGQEPENDLFEGIGNDFDNQEWTW